MTRFSSCPVRILIVDDELSSRNVLATMLAQVGTTCLTASSSKKALEILKEEAVDAVIADLNMPGSSGMELLAEIRNRYRHLVFLMATGVDDVRVGVQALKLGADDYLVKPLETDLVLASLERAFQKKLLEQEVENYRQHLEEMVAERTTQLQMALKKVEHSYEHTLESLGAAIDLRDGPTAGHSRRVCLYSITMLKALGGTKQQLKSIAMGAWLHDIGKLAIPDAILLKRGALTKTELEIMRCHVMIGYNLVKRIPFLADAAEIILTHHERCDGSGYPRGLRAAQIPFSSKIFAVADTFDAMTSDRPYRSAVSFQEAKKEIERGSGVLFDARVASTLLSFPNETWEAIRAQTPSIQVHTALAASSLQTQDTQADTVPGERS